VAEFYTDRMRSQFKQDVNTLYASTEGGSTVSVYSRPETTWMECPNCLFDPYNQNSANVYATGVIYPSGTATLEYPSGIIGPISFSGGLCPVCNGKGKLNYSLSMTEIVGLVTELEGDRREYLEGGKTFYADFTIRVDHSNYDLFKNSTYVMVNNCKAVVDNIKRLHWGGEEFKSLAYLTKDQRVADG